MIDRSGGRVRRRRGWCRGSRRSTTWAWSKIPDRADDLRRGTGADHACRDPHRPVDLARADQQEYERHHQAHRTSRTPSWAAAWPRSKERPLRHVMLRIALNGAGTDRPVEPSRPSSTRGRTLRGCPTECVFPCLRPGRGDSGGLFRALVHGADRGRRRGRYPLEADNRAVPVLKDDSARYGTVRSYADARDIRWTAWRRASSPRNSLLGDRRSRRNPPLGPRPSPGLPHGRRASTRTSTAGSQTGDTGYLMDGAAIVICGRARTSSSSVAATCIRPTSSAPPSGRGRARRQRRRRPPRRGQPPRTLRRRRGVQAGRRRGRRTRVVEAGRRPRP